MICMFLYEEERDRERKTPCADKRHTDTEGRQPCEDKGRAWVYVSQAKQCLGLSEAGRSKEGSYLRGLELGLSCQHLDFELLASRTVRE